MSGQINKTELNKLRSHIEKHKLYIDKYSKDNDDKNYSKALSMSILVDYFGLNQKVAYEGIVDGGNDNKIDAFYYSDDEDEVNELVIIQSKYKRIDGDIPTFTADEIKLCIESCKAVITGRNFKDTNEKLQKKLDDYRELLRQNGIPPISISLFFATNGIIHDGHKELDSVTSCAKEGINVHFIDATRYGIAPEIKNGSLLINTKNDDDKTDSVFKLDDNLVGKIISCKIENLMKFYAETGEHVMLNNNVRYGVKRSPVNKEIINSFIKNPTRFCLLNNGITIVCDSFLINHTGVDNNDRIDMERPSIVNGGQTISTLYGLYVSEHEKYKEQFEKASILIRVYQAPSDYILEIAKATNTQNPIDIVDLHSNDKAQNLVKEYFRNYGIGMICKVGEDTTYYDDTITNEELLQVYASLYDDEPGKAKLSKRTIFNKYYSKVFADGIDETMFKKLFRCYDISKFVSDKESLDKAIVSNASFSIMYAMKKINKHVMNENIPSENVQGHFEESFSGAYKVILEIIKAKQIELKTKFSLNNLFKGNEIKDLIDIKLDGCK